MDHKDFTESNCTHGKPAGWSDEQCGSLKTHQGIIPEGPNKGMSFIISHWVPTPEELRELNNGGGVYLMVLGKAMPPVSLFTQNPFIQPVTDGE